MKEHIRTWFSTSEIWLAAHIPLFTKFYIQRIYPYLQNSVFREYSVIYQIWSPGNILQRWIATCYRVDPASKKCINLCNQWCVVFTVDMAKVGTLLKLFWLLMIWQIIFTEVQKIDQTLCKIDLQLFHCISPHFQMNGIKKKHAYVSTI